MRHSIALLALAAGLLLASCGGGGDGGGSSTAPTLTGVFIDSPVQGLPYTTRPSGLSGRTGPNGEFQYRPGDFVVFFGSLILPIEAPGQPTITPFTLLRRTSVPDVRHEWPVNLARYLLGLDTTLGTDVITLPAVLPSIPPTTCFSCPNFDAEVAAAGIPLATEGDAIAHLKRQFAIWGSWTTSGTPSEIRVFTFLPNGRYLLAHDDDPAVAGGVDGMERGTYQWNAATNAFAYTVEVNTDGTGGLSNPNPTQTPPYTFVIDSGGNNAVLHFGPGPGNEIHLSRVVSSTNLLVGAWKLQVPFDVPFSAVVTSLPDGTFTYANDAFDTIAAQMERGTYTFDSVTGMLTMNITVDTSGPPSVDIVTANITEALGGDPDFLRLTEGGILRFSIV